MTPIQSICDRWAGLERPFFIKNRLIDNDGHCCAQGDVLRVSGVADAELREMAQAVADRQAARLLGISVAHSCLLRIVNDRQAGCPQDVLLHPERVLGDQAQLVVAFWRRLDGLTPEQWIAAGAGAMARWDAVRAWHAAWDAARAAARAAAGTAAKDAASAAARAAARTAPWEVAAATNEIQGAAIMRKRGKAFFFLPMFSIAHPAELDQ